MTSGRLRSATIAGAAGILSLAPAAFAQPAAPAAPAIARPATQAERLAGLLVPKERLMTMIGPMFDRMIEARIQASAEARDFYARHPQLRVSLVAVLKTEFERMMLEAMPVMQAELVGIIHEDLTEAETRAIADFFDSPVGRRMYAVGLQQAMRKSDAPDAEAKRDTVEAMTRSLTPAEVAQVERFGMSRAGAKFGRLTAHMGQRGSQWGQKIVEDNNDRLREVVDETMARYVEEYREAPAPAEGAGT